MMGSIGGFSAEAGLLMSHERTKNDNPPMINPAGIVQQKPAYVKHPRPAMWKSILSADTRNTLALPEEAPE
jgi:hypothetical protein